MEELKEFKMIFVLPENCSSELNTSNQMQQSFELCREYMLDREWIRYQDCLNDNWKKTDILVFDQFAGQNFIDLQKKECVIVGPWCLLVSLIDAKPIPHCPWPIYTVAMRDCYICCSSFPTPVKQELRQKIEWMGAQYVDNLTTGCTHLVTNSVKSEKYIEAANAGIKLMLSSWVEDVFTQSCESNVHCNDPQFQAHRCPPFHKLVMCCTGFNAPAERSEVENSIKQNGGIFKGQLNLKLTDILVCKDGTMSAKLKAALKTPTIKCVLLDWVTDSIKNGYAMSEKRYIVKRDTSTPQKGSENGVPDFSMISNISSLSSKRVLEETSNITTLRKANFLSTPLTQKKTSNEHNTLVDAINLSQVKAARQFLEGCSIYLTGFGIEQRERLCRILNRSGATRYDDISDRITHVIVGDPEFNDLKLIELKGIHCLFVSIHWLIECLNQKQVISEDDYIIRKKFSTIPDTTFSTKELEALQIEVPKQLSQRQETVVSPETEPEFDLLQQYLPPMTSGEDDTLVKLLNKNPVFKDKSCKTTPESTRNSSRKETFTMNSSDSNYDTLQSSTTPIFAGLKFLLIDFKEEFNEIKACIEKEDGLVVSSAPDYIVCSVFCEKIPEGQEILVNDFWLHECIQEQKLVDISYFHIPRIIDFYSKPLCDCVVCISGFTNYERNYLKVLIMQLGGVVQEQLSRVSSVERNVKSSTHLVTATASGKKFDAASRWEIPAISEKWLLACADSGYLVSVDKFLVRQANSEKLISETKVVTPKNNSSNKIEHLKNPLNKLLPENFQQGAASPITPINNILQEVRLNEVNDSKTKVETPKNKSSNKIDHIQTPVNKLLPEAFEEGAASQITPIHKIMQEARLNKVIDTPLTPLPKPYGYVDTPDSPLGACIRPNPSPNLRKKFVQWINKFPDFKPLPPKKDSTPLSEIKRKMWAKLCPPRDSLPPPKKLRFDEDDSAQPSCSTSMDVDEIGMTNLKEDSEDALVNQQLQEIKDMLTASHQSCSNVRRQSVVPVAVSESANSQTNTVGWDDSMDVDILKNSTTDKFRHIVLSGYEPADKIKLLQQLETINAKVSETTNYDRSITHLICARATRNEKTLACIAGGKWILHTSYIEHSAAAGKFLDEELYEYGNPKSYGNIPMPGDNESEQRMAAMFYWRTEIARRGFGPFHDFKVIIAAPKKDAIARVIEAGDGTVIDLKPPFTNVSHVTHCLLDDKSSSTYKDYYRIAKEGIYCIKPIYIHDYLLRRVNDIRDYVLTCYKDLYKDE